MRTMMLKKTNSNRRGVTLLFVLTLIVLFLLMGASFVLIANQFRRSAVVLGRIKVRRDDARTLVNRAFYDVFRGPSLDDARSPLRGHSILEDMYGYGIESIVSAAAFSSTSGNQLLNMTLDADNTTPEHQYRNLLNLTFGNFEDYSGVYDGQILTFVTGPAAGVSCRIVAYTVGDDPSNTFPRDLLRGFTIVPAWNDQATASLLSTPAQLVGSRVIINGRPFTGTGAGTYSANTAIYNPARGNNASLPNRVGERRNDLISAAGYFGQVGSTFGNPRAPNEDYDSWGYDDMFLGGYMPAAVPPLGPVIPSFARVALESANGWNPRSVFRAFNRGAAAALEVDNDGMNGNDSYWMDVGLPIQTDSKGRVYKPLVAYYIVDMDGRLNVNAHGNLAQLPANGLFKTNLNLLEPTFGLGATVTSFNAGLGFGTPEINFLAAITPGEYTQLLTGNGTLLGRYGSNGLPGDNTRDLASQYKLFGHPLTSTGNLFGSNMDVHGRFGFGTSNFWIPGLSVDPYGISAGNANLPVGFPVADFLSSTLTDEISNSAYEFDFGTAPFSTATRDAPFTSDELEGYLRRTDPDSAALPDRLRRFLATTDVRQIITTDSFEVPVPPTHLVNKLHSILIAAMPTGTPAEIQAVDTQIRLMLAPEIRRGLRMDINRPFGNGLDDGVTNSANGQYAGTVDEPGEQFVGENYDDSYGRTIPFDSNNDGIAGGNAELLSRQVFARHLYVLTLLVTQWVDRDGDGIVDTADWYDYNGSGGLPNLQDLYDYRRDVAQWAINVADFRDPDSIMTPFEFDLNPWDGWSVDGIIGPPSVDDGVPLRGLVWGAEHPELLITETNANHFRATEDLPNDSSGIANHTYSGGAGTDSNLDNRYVPNVSGFIELRNCRNLSNDATVNGNNQVLPAELYNANGLDLQRMSLDGTSPVWRIAIRERYTGDATPDENSDDFNAGGMPDPLVSNSAELKRIYFVEPAVVVDSGPKVYFPLQPNANPMVLPALPIGEFAVIGGGIPDGGRFDSYFGIRTTPNWFDELNDTRRVSLNPDTTFANNSVELRFWNSGTSAWQTQQRRAVAVPISKADPNYEGGLRPFGITDPLGGYSSLITSNPNLTIRKVRNGGGTSTSAGFEFFDNGANQPYPLDLPADANDAAGTPRPTWSNLYTNGMGVFPVGADALTPAGIRDDGLCRNHSVVLLQRLANPLLPFDAQANPYITVDAEGLDVNIQNGFSNLNEPDAIGSLPAIFATLERGSNNKSLFNRESVFWKSNNDGRYRAQAAPVFNPIELDTRAVGDSHFVSLNLFNSLGQVDVVDRYDRTTGFPNPPTNTIAYPWLNWNNRPFISQQELVTVPYGNALDMLGNFDTIETGRNAYNGTSSGSVLNSALPLIAGQFGHLFGFHTDAYSRNTAVSGAPSLHKILDYLEVPSRFVGIEKYFNPAVFSAGGTGTTEVFLGMNAPFNALSNYRYPGKINLNTISDQRVYNALMGNYAGVVAYGQFDASRRAGAGSGVPTDFPNVFRASEFANMISPNVGVPNAADTTLFRRVLPANDTPLLEWRPAVLPAPPHNDPTRSAHFRYEMRQRLGNLVTTRSSVFAIWITVGFFEVDPVTGNPIATGELEDQEGRRQRYRGFFIVDRSIPVACEPGENHNVDRAVLTESIWEENN